MPRWVATTVRLTPIVAGASLVAVLGLLLAHELVPRADLEASTEAVGNYLQTVGGIYAVLLAFVVYVVWGQFNDARGFVAREATTLVDLHRTASMLPAKSKAAIQKGLAEYADAVILDEWPAMARGDEPVIERVGLRLEQVWTAIHDSQPEGAVQIAVYAEVLSTFNDLTDLRTSRLTSARSRIPIAMKILLYSGAVITIGSMYLLAFGSLWVHATVTAALAGAIAHILFLIRDLDDAFAGDWMVHATPFDRARRAFARSREIVDFDATA
jgi:hypothetical protein